MYGIKDAIKKIDACADSIRKSLGSRPWSVSICVIGLLWCISACASAPAGCPDISAQIKQLSDTSGKLSSMTNYLILDSTNDYINGWANGMVYDRHSNMQLLSNISTLCNSSTTFIVDGSTWNTVFVDSPTCRSVLNYGWQQMYQLNYATPTVIPGF